MSDHPGRRVRIAFMIDEVRWPTAGTENQILKLISRLDRRRFDPYLVVLRSSPFLEQEWQGCEVHSLEVRRLLSPRGLWAIVRLSRWLREQRIEVIQTFFKDADAMGIVSSALARVPLRLSSRRNLKYDASRKDMLVYRGLKPFVHYYLTNGRMVKEHVVESERVSPARVRVFYNLLDEEIERRANAVAGQTRGSGESIVRFVMIANLRPIKGHAFLIEAVNGIRERLANARFVLVGGVPPGEASEHTEVHQQVESNGLSHLFEFAGLHADVGGFLEAADAGLLCSRSEGFSSTLLEYTAMGLPCIATDVGSNSEMVRSGFNGHLVRYGDVEALQTAILDLYGDPAARRLMGENSRAHFEARFQPAPQIEALEEFYLEALAASGSARRE